MKTFLLVLLLVAVLGVILPFAFFYWRFHQSPAKLWKSRLFRLREELYARRRVLMAGSSEPDSELRHAGERLFKTYLAGIPATAMTEFPGIGPGTVEKLRQVGLKSVADLPGFVFESVPGIGPTKGAELRAALATLVEQCRSKFDAGGCKEGQEYRALATQRAAERQRREQGNIREAQAIDSTLADLDQVIARAAGVTFANFFTRKPHGVPPDVLTAPLPVVHVPAAPLPPPMAVPTPPPVLAASPAMAKKTPTAVVLPPTMADRKPMEPKDLFEDMLGSTAAKVSATAASEPAGLATMRVLARFGFLMAKADGRIAQAERKAVRSYLEQKFGGDPVLVRFIDVTMEEAEKSIPPEADAVAGVLAATAESEREAVAAWAERIVDASGERNAKEAELVRRVRSALVPLSPGGEGDSSHLPSLRVGRRAAAGGESSTSGSESPLPVAAQPTSPQRGEVFQPPTADGGPRRGGKQDPRTLLDIAPEVELSADLIRRRYSLLTEKLDPLKAAAMGAEFAKLAEDKRAALKAAAEELLTPFGEPLEKPTAPPSTDLRPNQDLDEAFGM